MKEFDEWIVPRPYKIVQEIHKDGTTSARMIFAKDMDYEFLQRAATFLLEKMDRLDNAS